jgi:RNA polymerase sigma-70 factor (ECF subfamily)
VSPPPATILEELARVAARDRGLVRRMVAGDDAALSALVRIYKGNLWGLATSIVRNREAARDVVQVALLEIWDRRAEYDAAVGTVAGWMLNIVRSRALDHLRAEARRAAHEAEAAGEAARASAEETLPGRPGLEQAELQVLRRWLAPAVAALPEEQRRVMELSFEAGLTRAEVAVATGQPEGTVASQLRLAMRKLRAEMTARDAVVLEGSG